MPSWSHQTLRRLSPWIPVEANGAPLSLADGVGKAAGAEQVAEVGFHSGAADIRQGLAAEQIAAEVIEDGERVAVGRVAHAELALEVDGPDLVRRRGGEGSRPGVLPGAAAAAMVHVAVAAQNIEDGAAGRPGTLRVAGAQAFQDLAGAPA